MSDDLDTMLYRPLRDGRKFDALFPRSACKRTASGEGTTDFSVTEIAAMVTEHSGQVAKVAPLLLKSSLEETCYAIHDFAFNHFQYRADGLDQLLRSPACCWHDRRNGIDCKSYTILASCILTQMGISHYVRKIKQPGFEPTEYTHVYAIVPADQETGSLASGYYVIDGTIPTMDEPAFVQTKDTFMDGLPHYRLNGARGAVPQGWKMPHGLGLKIDLNSITSNCSSSSTNPNEIKKLLPAGLQQTLQGSGLLSQVSASSLNNFVAVMNRMDASAGKLIAVGGCTGEAGKYLRRVVQQTLAAVLDTLRSSGYTLTPAGKKETNISFTFATYNQGKPITTAGYPSDSYSVSGGNGAALQFDVSTLNLTIGSGGSGPLPVIDIPIGNGNSGSNNPGSSNPGTIDNGNGNGNGNNGSGNSIFTTTNVVLGATALGALWYFTQPKNKAA